MSNDLPSVKLLGVLVEVGGSVPAIRLISPASTEASGAIGPVSGVLDVPEWLTRLFGPHLYEQVEITITATKRDAAER